jgi:hypothetical protein
VGASVLLDAAKREPQVRDDVERLRNELETDDAEPPDHSRMDAFIRHWSRKVHGLTGAALWLAEPFVGGRGESVATEWAHEFIHRAAPYDRGEVTSAEGVSDLANEFERSASTLRQGLAQKWGPTSALAIFCSFQDFVAAELRRDTQRAPQLADKVVLDMSPYTSLLTSLVIGCAVVGVRNQSLARENILSRFPETCSWLDRAPVVRTALWFLERHFEQKDSLPPRDSVDRAIRTLIGLNEPGIRLAADGVHLLGHTASDLRHHEAIRYHRLAVRLAAQVDPFAAALVQKCLAEVLVQAKRPDAALRYFRDARAGLVALMSPNHEQVRHIDLHLNSTNPPYLDD